MSRAPVLFVSHGVPTVALEHGGFAAAMASFAAAIERPRAILVVSAHWTTPWEIGITSAARHRLIYDFAGFPDALYQIAWPAPGAPDVAARAAAMLEAAGFRGRLDPVRGLDHGAWIPLRLAFPAADVPVAQLALPELEAPVLETVVPRRKGHRPLASVSCQPRCSQCDSQIRPSEKMIALPTRIPAATPRQRGTRRAW